MDTKITIGVLSQGILKTDMVSSLIMALYATPHPFNLLFYQSPYIHDSRNKIVEAAIKEGSTHLMFIDHDMAFPQNAITTLLGRGKDVIGGLYNRRGFPKVLAAFGDNPTVPLRHEEIQAEPFKVSAIGTGFMLIDMGVFNLIERPYFSVEPLSDGNIGEDVYFCMKAGRAGVDVWADPTIPIKHIGDYAY